MGPRSRAPRCGCLGDGRGAAAGRGRCRRRRAHVPLLDPERDPQGGEVGSVLGGVVGRQVDALAGQPVPARPGGRVALGGNRRIEGGQAERFALDGVDLRADQRWLSVRGAALVNEDDFPVGVDALGHGQVGGRDRGAARPAGQPDDRIGPRGGGDGLDPGDADADRRAVGSRPVLRDGEVAAAELAAQVELGDRGHVGCRARGRLESGDGLADRRRCGRGARL